MSLAGTRLPYEKRWMTLKEFHGYVCDNYEMRLSIRTIRRYCENGSIPASMRGRGQWFIDTHALRMMWDDYLLRDAASELASDGIHNVEFTPWQPPAIYSDE